MKRILALIMVLCLVLILLISMGAICMAETVAQTPQGPPETAVMTPPTAAETQPAVVYTTGADPPKIDLTPLLQAILSLCVSLITMFLIPWLRSKYSAEQRQRIAAVYQTIVYAAEQIFGAGRGNEKLDWATIQLEAKGMTVDRAILEAEVRKMQSFTDVLLAEPVSGAPPGAESGTSR
jgi:hypothetical protein